MAAAQAPVVYTVRAIEEYINQRFIGNQAELEQRLATGAGYLEQCATQMATTDQKAETLAAKMVEDEKRINEIVRTANDTRVAVHLTHDKDDGDVEWGRC